MRFLLAVGLFLSACLQVLTASAQLPIGTTAIWTTLPFDRREDWGVLHPGECKGKMGYFEPGSSETNEVNHTRFLELYRDGYHAGIDYNGRCPAGSNYDLGGKVRNIAMGSVYDYRTTYAGEGFGRYVIMDYRFANGFHARCRYFHLDTVATKARTKGAILAPNEQIGTVGNSGTASAHLHIDCYDADDTADSAYGGDLVNPYHGGTGRPPATPRMLAKFFSPALLVDDFGNPVEIPTNEGIESLPNNWWYSFVPPMDASGLTAVFLDQTKVYTIQQAASSGLISSMVLGFNSNVPDVTKWWYHLNKENIFFRGGKAYIILVNAPHLSLILFPVETENRTVPPYGIIKASPERARYLREDRARQDLIRSVRNNLRYKDREVRPNTLSLATTTDVDCPSSTDWDMRKMDFTFDGTCNGTNVKPLCHAIHKQYPLERRVRIFNPATCSYDAWQCIDRNDLFAINPRPCKR
ncbi:MAG: hypothetical protein A2756_05590 [Candidatus Ryanbacteria bacterium RIFCSPHIGHO2_01_FULL_48_27]|uniref:M23ase beta-sheet core domain-containing protein n=1 Tax=Candidatus Ryanbacteria bacterium RIFCSPHIGHO2_01_FULL_48_27 TaxID=1802115 RepID=A0A1G2G2W1_9BACT|nr:MAG: hypothetical protein A2756_05590 [Candidatus Ryanbacteria bacterium RIFCSPHIGHO2_01_FULL_48_27]